jgi:hypothetical protein
MDFGLISRAIRSSDEPATEKLALLFEARKAALVRVHWSFAYALRAPLRARAESGVARVLSARAADATAIARDDSGDSCPRDARTTRVRA